MNGTVKPSARQCVWEAGRMSFYAFPHVSEQTYGHVREYNEWQSNKSKWSRPHRPESRP